MTVLESPPAPAAHVDPVTQQEVPDDPGALAIRERIGAPADQLESSRGALAAARWRMEET